MRLLMLPCSLLLLLGSCDIPPIPPIPTPTPPPAEGGFDCDTQAQKGLKPEDVQGLVAGKFIVLLKAPTERQPSPARRGVDVAAFAALFELTVVEAYTETVYGFSAKIEDPVRVVAALLTDARVRAVYPVVPMRVPEPSGSDISPEITPGSWGIDRVDQRDLPLDNIFAPDADGAGVVVGILDTGILPEHADYAGRVEAEFYDKDGGGCRDDHGHATHVSGTAVGTKYGIAKKARLWCGKVLTGGTGDDAGVIGGIDAFTQWCQAHGATCVGNMSLGGDHSTPLDEAVCRSLEAGVAWAVAAGNDGADACGGSPSDVKQGVTAGATTRTDSRAGFSNRGQCVTLFAPGQDIVSAKWRGGETTMSGTSMASPHVAGVLALIRGMDATITPAQAKAFLVEAATNGKVSDPGTGSPNELLFFKAGPTPTPPPSAPPTAPPTTAPSAPPTTAPSAPPSTPPPTAPPSPPQANCKTDFKADATGWGLLTCTLNGKQFCGQGTGKKCGCDGDGCTFTIPKDAKCAADSTARYNGELPNWKTCTCESGGPERPCAEWPVCADGTVGRSEYPPGPRKANPKKGIPAHPGYFGWHCHSKTKWIVPADVTFNPDSDWSGSMHFPKAGTHKIRAQRDDAPGKGTTKSAKVQ